MKNRKIILSAFLLAVVLLTFCSCGKSEKPEMNVDIKDGQRIYNGTEQRFYQVDEGMEGELEIAVNRNSGTINITVVYLGSSEEFCYQGTDIPTSEFTVSLPYSGEYKVLTQADNFNGSYTYIWRTNPAE
ncbi:MAG: hypothetical protein ACI4I3_09350 [Acutalibacteraceae bacterium]